MDDETLQDAELELQSDGSARLRVPRRLELEVDGRGEAALNIASVHAIGIENLPDLASHGIVRDARGTTHLLEFVDGGTACVSYGEDGKLRDLSAEGVGMSLAPGGMLVLKPYNLRPGG